MNYGGKCEFCGRDVDAAHAAYPVKGWEVSRGQGGANRILGRERTPNRVAHVTCVERDLLHGRGQTGMAV